MAELVDKGIEGNITRKICEIQKEKRNKKPRKKKMKSRKPVVEVNTRKDQRIIYEYHTLSKKIDSVMKNRKLLGEEKASEIAVLEAKREKLGGIDAYQKASKLGESRHGNFNSAKWVIRQLKNYNICTSATVQVTESEKGKLKLLDVGALENNYKKQRKWIDCMAIDSNPQSGSVLQADFLKLDCKVKYDVVVLSLVINFEGDSRRRGYMLQKCNKLVMKHGLLFIVLPVPCLTNSRYFNKELFTSMLHSLGFELWSSHNSRKLSFFMFQKTAKTQSKSFPKQLVRKGGNRNNFAIVL